jgi:hypothetical protein
MSKESQNQTTGQPRKAPRIQRGAAAVIAQYIQDLTHPTAPLPCAPAA